MKQTIQLLTIAVLFFWTINTQGQKFDFEKATITSVGKDIRSNRITVVELTKLYLSRIDSLNPLVNAMLVINPEALALARKADLELKAGLDRGKLHGIPVILKDNIDTHDKMPTTAGSRALAESIALNDAFIVEKLREAGAIIIGKANLSEWANFRSSKSSSGWSGVGGQTNNPYKLDCNPCGSSAGSGVAISSDFCLIAIGTETNGSIVCPSNANGVVGIKPTVGLLSRSGIIPISYTQDTPGPMARNVTDAAISLGFMTGLDLKDSITKESEGKYFEDYTQFLQKDGLKGKRIGIFQPPLGKMKSVDSLFFKAVDYMKSQGAEFVDVSTLGTKDTGKSSFEVLLYEFKDGLNKYFAGLNPNQKIKNIEDLFAFNASDNIETGVFDQKLIESAMKKGNITEKEYLEAKAKMHQEMREEGIDKVMNELQLDAIIAPTGSPAWKTDWKKGDTFHIGSSSPAAIAGYPNITVPMGFVGELPVNISFFGRAYSEPILLSIVYAFEQGTMHRKSPKFLK
ncbi:amidase [Lacihabitans sp. LS3-19]|uniref:amidase n=1 Tax=Lacihabitans sp. LS3-19 TaxID=2487335 RepID=UPI0020CC2E1B|nr:amidase [Lacihabitans sp. LS3-19]MCP9766347.1 amidase [Lacihabitans sp. LS3-19]